MFEKIKMSHDAGLDWLEEVLPAITKEKSVDLFLSSLSTRQLTWRFGLPTLAVLKNYPRHKFSPAAIVSHRCDICGDFSMSADDERNLGIFNQFIITTGGLHWSNFSPVNMAFYVDQFSRIERKKPSAGDVIIFENIMNVIRRSKPTDSANDMEKKIGQLKILKSNKDERRYILDTLSLCGILETEEHKGYFDHFIDTATRDQRERGAFSNDWGYPIRWWKGKDGINERALHYWFGDYLQP